MQPNKKTISIIATAIAAILVLGWYISQPRTYEDCLLAHIKEAQSDRGATAIALACRAKFPLPTMTHEEFMGKAPAK